MAGELTNPVVLITSRDPDNSRFGTGFVIQQSGDIAYILTCAHVVKDIGGSELIQVNSNPGVVVASGEEDGLDLAVVKVEGLPSIESSFNLSFLGETGKSFRIDGFRTFDRNHLRKLLQGTLGQAMQLTPRGKSSSICAWELNIVEGTLEPGYSGSPVIDEKSGSVLGIVSHRQGNSSGLAISIEALERIWKPIDSEQLYQSLLKLGYRNQVRLFRRMIESHPAGAFLVHGSSEEHGQRWLVNRLVNQFLPHSLTDKIIRVELDRVGRRNDTEALWRELGKHAGFKGRLPTPLEIVERVYLWWQTRNVVLVLYDVDCLTETLLSDLIHQFWLLLATRTEAKITNPTSFKLLMFLVDYQGCTTQWNVPFVERLDSSKPYTPIRSPQIMEFSEEELIEWIEDGYGKLPLELTQDMEKTVQVILEDSDHGIPERTFGEICDRCDRDWYEESRKWMKL